MRIVAIDPGQTGAVCFMTLVDGQSSEIVFEPMPLVGKEVDAHKLAQIFSVMLDAHVFVEKVSSMPKQGVASMFKFGRNVGMLQAMLAAYKLPYTEVTPQRWQKLMHEGLSRKSLTDPKHRSLAVAKRLFPHVNLLRTSRCKKPDEGFVDALLIAEYGRRIMANVIELKQE